MGGGVGEKGREREVSLSFFDRQGELPAAVVERGAGCWMCRN